MVATTSKAARPLTHMILIFLKILTGFFFFFSFCSTIMLRQYLQYCVLGSNGSRHHAPVYSDCNVVAEAGKQIINCIMKYIH